MLKSILASLAVSLCTLPPHASADIPRQTAVGDTIPDVSVKTADATEVNLREAVKTKPTVLVFYRGGWCPYCSRHLMALAGIENDLAAAGFQLLAISADRPEKIAETPNRDKLHYTLLSDDTMTAAKAFGLTFKVPDETVAKYKNDYQIDLEAASGQTHHLLPHPAVFIVDQAGVVRFAHVNQDYKIRLDPAIVLKTAREVAAVKTP